MPQNTRNRESDCALCRKGSLHPHIAAGSCVSYHHPKPRIILQFRIGNPESDCTLRGTCLHAGGLCVSNHPRPRIGPRFDCGILCRKGSLPVTDCAFRTQKQQNCSCIVCFVPLNKTKRQLQPDRAFRTPNTQNRLKPRINCRRIVRFRTPETPKPRIGLPFAKEGLPSWAKRSRVVYLVPKNTPKLQLHRVFRTLTPKTENQIAFS